MVERGLSPAALADVMKFVEPGSGEVVAIRPDITPQIARLYAARPDALPSPARLCYDGPVLRAREARAGRPREVYQAGVELLGAGGASADAEALVGARARARARGARRGRDRGGARPLRARGHRGGRARAEGAGEPRGTRCPARTRVPSRRSPGRRAATPACAQALPELATLYGDGALARARRSFAGVPGAAAALGEVEAALRLARRRGVSARSRSISARPVGSATTPAVTFAGYAPGAGSAVAAGGRYDELLARFGRPGPAIGFAVDLEFATQALERANGRARGRSARKGRKRPR